MENIVKITGTEGTITIPNPWLHDRINPPISKIIVQKAGQKDPEEINVTTDGTSFQIEADVFGGLVQSGTQEASSPAMSWADTLGNMQTLDRWRAEVGLTYSIEKLDNFRKTTVSGKALAVDPKNNMKYGQIPHLDRKVSRLIYGCDNQHTLAHMVVMADDAFEKGINTFDTAWLYGGGRMETLLGQWMKLRGVRKDMNIIMKGGHTPYCYPANITNMITQSLERMQIDSAEIYIMHRDNLDVPVGEFVDVLNEHKKAGRIKCFGGSNWTIARLAEANEYARKKGLQPLSLLNNNFSLARMVNPVWPGCVAASDPESRAFLTKNQIANLSWSSQARGFFVPGIAAPEKTSNKELVNSWYAEDNFQRQARAIELAKKYKVEPITIALAYVLCQPFPSFALIGPRSLSETRTSLPALDIQLSEAELKWLNLELDRA
jgi:aryl-alcohol dehydrogenase-like predicted oxidoreductase